MVASRTLLSGDLPVFSRQVFNHVHLRILPVAASSSSAARKGEVVGALPNSLRRPEEVWIVLDRIGHAAGDIWRFLASEGGSASLAKIRERTKLDTETVYLGLGWLAREDKIDLERRGRSLRVTLTSVQACR